MADDVEPELPADPEMDAQQAALFRTAREGMDTEAMLNHPFVRFVLGEAAQASQEAMAALVDVDPLDTRRIVDLQGRARYAEDMGGWLKARIERGHEAVRQLQDIEQR